MVNEPVEKCRNYWKVLQIAQQFLEIVAPRNVILDYTASRANFFDLLCANNAASTPRMKNWTYIFVYGQLRQGMNHPMQNLLVRHATYLGTGSFQGKLYDLGRYPGAVHSRSPKDRVLGDIYRIDETSPVMARLDEHEGHRFTREEVQVRVDHEDQIKCWTYLYNRSVAGRVLIPSGDYVEYYHSLARAH